uniref:ribonuclease H n=1 Tax=Leptobrachium leishanense TaxID=445787 RepID=A0A8C5LYR7_9ANUR
MAALLGSFARQHNPASPHNPQSVKIAVVMQREEKWRTAPTLSATPDPHALLLGIPEVGAEENPPRLVELKPGATPVALRQYHIPQKAKQNIQIYLQRFKDHGILKFCVSPWNTPLLPVLKEGTQEYRPVQDLRAVNEATVTLHPVVPNLYNLLALIPGDTKYYTVFDLKDAFFCICLAPASQPLFAFQWEESTTGARHQMTWTRLPQGFKNSPTIFGCALSQDLLAFNAQPDKVVLLQYVDDLLLASPTEKDCLSATKALLHLLSQAGYRVSKKKAQICKRSVKYLGFQLTGTKRALGAERKEAVCRIPQRPGSKSVSSWELQASAACGSPTSQILPSRLIRPRRGGGKDPFHWKEEQTAAFQKLKTLLMEAPALGLPDHSKPFQLFVHEHNQTATGVLVQTFGSWLRPVAYLSKQLDPVACGLPLCLKAVAATAMLIAEADKLTLGQVLYVKMPHAVKALLDVKGGYWFSSRPDLKDVPLDKYDLQLFTDGSSYMDDGKKVSGYAVVSTEEVIEAKPLPGHTSAQLAEITALTRALEISEGKRVNIYTDSKYAFMTVHAHGALYKERGLLTSSGQQIKYAAEIAALLEAVWKPSAVSIMHCRGHQKGHDEIPKGNRRADQAAKAAAKPPPPTDHQATVLICKQEPQPSMPNYEFYMNLKKFEPHGEFIEIILHKWQDDYELLELNYDYIQWLFPTRTQGRNFYSTPLNPQETRLMVNTSEVQQRLRRAYKMMLKFFGVKIVGEEEDKEITEVERAENFASRFENLTINLHNNLRITRILHSLGELEQKNIKSHW